MKAMSMRRQTVTCLVLGALLTAVPALSQEATSGGVFTPDASNTFRSPNEDALIHLLINQETSPGTPAAMSLLTALPGLQIPEHVHEDSDEFLYIMSGGGEMVLGEETLEVSEGSAIRIPAGVPHSFTAGQSATVAVQMYVGPGPENRFRGWNPIQWPSEEPAESEPSP